MQKVRTSSRQLMFLFLPHCIEVTQYILSVCNASNTLRSDRLRLQYRYTVFSHFPLGQVHLVATRGFQQAVLAHLLNSPLATKANDRPSTLMSSVAVGRVCRRAPFVFNPVLPSPA
jgi:hypothetical protein